MAAKYDFPDITKGDTFLSRTITIEVNGSPLDLTGATPLMQLRLRPGAKVEHEFDLTISDAAGGEITINEFDVELDYKTYYYDLQITLSDDTILTYIKGKFKVLSDISA